MSVKHQVNFNSSLFTTGLDKQYDLTKFKTVLSSEGLDLYDMGKSATITKSNAQTVFSELQPNERKLNVDFLSKLKLG